MYSLGHLFILAALAGAGSPQVTATDCKWFCVVTINKGVIGKFTSLQEAQSQLGVGDQNNQQAIIPMTDNAAGDPHTLPKTWNGGSMWWGGWPDINKMQDICKPEQPLCPATTAAPKALPTSLPPSIVDPIPTVVKTGPNPSCACAKPNEDIVCKKNQRKEKYLTDDSCRCEKYRCIWEICPDVVNITCAKCQERIEVDDCGCKQYECHDKAPKYCSLKPVKCSPCEKLERSEDECGCPVDQCVPLEAPKTDCPCNECEECSQIETGPPGCGLTKGICLKKPCPTQAQGVCDVECTTTVFGTDRCDCPTQECQKRTNGTMPDCGECQEPKQKTIERCDLVTFDCVAKQCHQPTPEEAVCLETDPAGDDKCGCPTYKKKVCSLVPAGDCPKGTVAKGGFDTCGCPHQICVPCKQAHPDDVVCDHACHKKVKKTIENGQCEVEVCVPTTECGCPQPEQNNCGECEVVGPVKLSDSCTVDACKPSTKKKCICKDLIEKKKNACGKCEKKKRVKTGPCAGIKTCEPMSVEDCPVLGDHNCDQCQQVEIVKDDCKCPKYQCSPKPCTPLNGTTITCSTKKTSDCKWFCAVTINKGVIGKFTSLQEAQSKLGVGDQNNQQAIIPMTDNAAGDPHTLPKTWNGGSMWWWDWPNINKMQDKCKPEQRLCQEVGVNQVAAVGKDACGCQVHTCVPDICEKKTTPAA